MNDEIARLKARINNDFVHHAPKEGQGERYGAIREAGRLMAMELLKQGCPIGRELSCALTKIDEAVFWANAAIARNE